MKVSFSSPNSVMVLKVTTMANRPLSTQSGLQSELTHLISVQRSDGVFLLETDWLFEGL